MTSTVFTNGTVIAADWLNDVNDAIYDPDGASYVTYTPDGVNAVPTTIQEKLREKISPEDFGAVGNGSTDDTVALQRAITHAQTINGTVDGNGKWYAISSKLTFSGIYACTFKDINLIAIAGTWPTGANGSMLYITQATNSAYSNYSFINVNCNANNIAKNCFYQVACNAKVSYIDCNAFFFTEKGFFISQSGNSDTKFIGCTSAERLWTTDMGDAFNIYANRTAYAFYIDDSSDLEFIDCVGYGSKYSLYITGATTGPWNQTFVGCKFWNGPARTDATSITVAIVKGEKCQFVGCRFDDGSVRLNTFKHSFIGCDFIQFDLAGQLQLQAIIAGETATGLIVSGCSFTGNSPISMTTSGSGTWATDVLAICQGNIKTNGGTVTLNGWETLSNGYKVVDGQAIFGNNSGSQLFSINGAAGQNRLYEARTAGLKRWAWGATAGAESGSNAGSTFTLYRYSDAGTYIDAPFAVMRDTGNSLFWKPVTFLPTTSAPSLTVNGQVTFELTDNTTLTFKGRGTDGTTRSGTITLA